MVSRPAEPLSPELVLVAPPEEAERAREQLDEAPLPNWEEFLADIRSRPEPTRQEVETAPETWAPSPRRRRRRRTIVAAVVALAAVAAAAVALLRDDSPRQPSSAPSSAPVSAPAPSPTPTTPARRAAGPTPKAKTPRKAAPVKPKRKVSRPAKRSAPRKSGFVPARVFSWAAAPGSRQYRVQFFRDGKMVLDLRATKPRLVLPKTFTFRPGHYRWTVVPIARNGELRPAVVNSTFVVG